MDILNVKSILQIASRMVMVAAGCIAIILALVGKFGAIMTSIPDPVIGGCSLVTLGILVAVGLSSLSTVDLTSSRNLSVIGVSVYVALVIPGWLSSNPNSINTGICILC